MRPKCINCNKIISYYCKKCNDCYAVERKALCGTLAKRRNYKCPSGENHQNWLGGNSVCIDCGIQKKYRDKKRIRCKSCSYKYRVGPSNPSWRGGITPINLKVRNSIKYIDWRKTCMERDSFTCSTCGQVGKNLHVDHIKPFALIMKQNNVKTIQEALSCIELWDINNGRTLCVECHKKTSTYSGGTFKLIHAN